MIGQPKMLAKVNAAIRRIAKKSGSKMIEQLVAVQLDNIKGYGYADYLFSGILDISAMPVVSGAEVTLCGDNRLDDCIRVKIINAMCDMKNLLEDNIALLRKE